MQKFLNLYLTYKNALLNYKMKPEKKFVNYLLENLFYYILQFELIIIIAYST